jgi:hypothetical protein
MFYIYVSPQMLSQKNSVVRESTVILASAAADQRLADAFLHMEDIQKLLDEERVENSRKVTIITHLIVFLTNISHIAKQTMYFNLMLLSAFNLKCI